MSVIDITNETIESTINENDMVVFDFWAEWCGPCKSFAPVFETVAEKNPDIVFGRVNIEEQQQIAGMFGIRSIPTLAIFREQQLVMMEAGAMPQGTLEQAIEAVRGLDMEQVRADLAERARQARAS